MSKLNIEYFQKWIIDSISAESNRHLFFDLNQRLIDRVITSYSQSKSVNFLPSNYSFWIYNDPENSDANYFVKDKVSKINFPDLLKYRNTGELNPYVVLVPNNPKSFPGDSIINVSELYWKSEYKYIEYITDKVFVAQFNLDARTLTELKLFIFDECTDCLDFCFDKKIDRDQILKFYGIIGNEKHLDNKYFKKSSYYKSFILRIQEVLENESFMGLEKRLSDHKVTNYEKTLIEFKKEGFNYAKDLARNIYSVFLKSTDSYFDLIIVDEWIHALKEIEEDFSIQFEDKSKDDVFNLTKVAKSYNQKGRKYVLRRDQLSTILSSGKEATWSINNDQRGKYINLIVLERNELLEIKSELNQDQKAIKLINYNYLLNSQNFLDYGVRIKVRFDPTEKLLNINNKNSKENNLFSSLKSSLKSQYARLNKLDDNSFHDKIDLDNKNTKLFEVKDKSLFENSNLDMCLRLVDKDAKIDIIILEDEEGDIKFYYDGRKEIEVIYNNTNCGFRDVTIILENISFNRLYIKLKNQNELEWLVFNFKPEGTKPPLEVKNYFQKYQALNDSSLANRVISISSRISNEVHSYYFTNKYNFKETYLPTIFNLEGEYELINLVDTNPYIAGPTRELYRDVRPKRSLFNKLSASNEFKEYIKQRTRLVDLYEAKFSSYDIRSIDDIDFSSDDFHAISIDYLKAYYNLIKIEKAVKWIDTFYFCGINQNHNRLEFIPEAIFFSPYNPILLHQLVWKMRLMRNTLEQSKKPNSISALLKINIIESWVLETDPTSKLYVSINTDSVLFTGFILAEHAFKENILESILKKIEVSYSQSVGHLSTGQIKSALNKSYNYLSNKSTFNIRLVGKLPDNSTNVAILDWLESKTNELSNLYSNFKFQVNIYDCRDSVCYPDENLLSYYREQINLNFDWYKIDDQLIHFDLTLITSLIPDITEINQKEEKLRSQTFTYKNLVNTELSRYHNKALYKDIFIKNYDGVDDFDKVIWILNDNFQKELSYNQTATIISNQAYRNSEVVAISSDISNTFILEEVLGKSLWEFSISDYSYQDSGKGDYYLLAEEQPVYTNKLKSFLNEIDPQSTKIFDQFLSYAKKTGLFEIRHLISNQNFIKGFIASVAARKIIDNIIKGSSDTFIIPYDVFKNRLHKIKFEVDPIYRDTGTQFPDFILIQISKDEMQWTIDLRLIEVKYRNSVLTNNEIELILAQQTNKIKVILCKLNNLRYEDIEKQGLWVNTLSLILSEMSQFYFNNSLDVNEELVKKFGEAINSDYYCRINESMLMSVDLSANITTGKTNSGIFIKLPQTKINEIFSNNDDLNKSFLEFFNSMQKFDTCDLAQNSIENIYSDESVFDQNEFEDDLIDNSNIDSNSEPKKVDNGNFEPIIELGSEEIITSPIVNNLKVIFGKDDSNREVIYYPKGKGNSPLPNYNIMVTGSSGKGKTQFIKSFIFQQGRKDTSFLVIDFKNDYSDNEFCELCNLKKISVKLNGIPYNPLIPRVVIDEDSREKYYDVSEHINGICSVLGSTFGLGDQQEAQLKRAVREVFKLSGLETKGTLKYKDDMSFPTFNEVGDYLESGDKDLEKLYNRLDPLFDLNLFPDKFKNVGFENVIKESYIIKVSDIQNDKIKNAIAKLIVVSAHGYYLGSSHRSNVYKYFVFDEAHRILDSSFVEKFIRECRAFGVGVLLSSQQPDDFPNDVLGQLATKIIHGNEGIAKLTKKIKDLISFSQDDRYINNLQTFEAIVNNQDYNNYIIKTLSWPHLMTLEAIKDFPLGISKDGLNSHLIKRGVKGSELMNLLNTLESKNYIKKENDLYKIS